MKSSEVWLRDYETAKQLADDTLAMIQVVLNIPSPLLHTLRHLYWWPLVTFQSMQAFMLSAPSLPCCGRAGVSESDGALYCARSGISNSHMGARRPLV